MLTVEQTAGSVPCGPDPEPIVDAVREFVDAGYDHVYLHQVGQDMDGFVRCWTEEVRPELERTLVRA
jgi:hypothetical protein